MSKKIKLVIEVDEETAKYIQGIKEFDCGDTLVNEMFEAIHNGTPITEGDMISRQELLDNIQKVIEDSTDWDEDWDKGYNCGLHKACELIETALSIGGNQNE